MMLFTELAFWHWLLLGIFLVLLEIFSPGVYLLWLGLAAGATGLLLGILPDLAWQVQGLSFALFSLGSILAARWWLQRRPLKTDQPFLNRRGAHYIGRVFTLQTPIQHGQGKIQVDDTRWKVQGADCPAGSQVQVVGVDGVVLQVKPID